MGSALLSALLSCCPYTNSNHIVYVGFWKAHGLYVVQTGGESSGAGAHWTWKFLDQQMVQVGAVALGEAVEDISRPQIERAKSELVARLGPSEDIYALTEAISVEAGKALGWQQLVRRDKCDFNVRATSKALTVLWLDPETKQDLPVVSKQHYKGPARTEWPAASTHYSFVGCYELPERRSLLVVRTAATSGYCDHNSDDELVLFEPSQVQYLRDNVYGFRALQAGDRQSARKLFEASLKQKPDYHHAAFNLACTLALDGEPFEPHRQLLEGLLDNPSTRLAYSRKIADDADLTSWRARPEFSAWFEAKRNAVLAEERRLRILAKPGHASNEAGMEAYARKDYDRAIANFSAAIEQDPAYVLAHLNLASVYALVGRHQEALHYLRSAHELDPGFTRRKMRADKDFASLVDNPRFVELLQGTTR